MEIVRIFANKKSMKGLHSIRYDNSKKSEYDVLFYYWIDRNNIRNYLKANWVHVSAGFFGRISLEEATNEVKRDFMGMFTKLQVLDNAKENEYEKIFDTLFKPLSTTDEIDKELIRQKNVYTGKSKVRLYAIRIEPDIYVVTGSAIKITPKMQDHKDTNLQLIKINSVKSWMKSIGMTTGDDLIYYYDDK